MRIQWLIILTSVTALAGGVVSLWGSRGCTPLETPNDCVVEEAYRGWWSASGDPQALELFTEAVVRDPASPQRWCDLADELLVSGDRKRAMECSRRGLMLGPRVPSILLRTLNFSVLTGCGDDAITAAGRLLELAPGQYEPMVFAQLSRAGCGEAEIQTKLVPQYPAAARRYRAFLLEQQGRAR